MRRERENPRVTKRFTSRLTIVEYWLHWKQDSETPTDQIDKRRQDWIERKSWNGSDTGSTMRWKSHFNGCSLNDFLFCVLPLTVSSRMHHTILLPRGVSIIEVFVRYRKRQLDLSRNKRYGLKLRKYVPYRFLFLITELSLSLGKL